MSEHDFVVKFPVYCDRNHASVFDDPDECKRMISSASELHAKVIRAMGAVGVAARSLKSKNPEDYTSFDWIITRVESLLSSCARHLAEISANHAEFSSDSWKIHNITHVLWNLHSGLIGSQRKCDEANCSITADEIGQVADDLRSLINDLAFPCSTHVSGPSPASRLISLPCPVRAVLAIINMAAAIWFWIVGLIGF